MKATLATLSSLLVLSVFSLSAHAATLAGQALLAFKSCGNAISKHLSSEPLNIRPGYSINLFRISPQSPKSTHIIGWIENRPLNGEETPTITAVCVENTQVTSDKGTIDFHSGPKDKIYIRFHLEGLQRSKWKKDTSTGFTLANDSVMMQEFKEGETPPKPNLKKWPACAKPKHVDLSPDPVSGTPDTDISFNFSRCVHAGSKNRVFEYTLVLAKYPANGGGGEPVDAEIDPVIINRP